MSTHTSFNFHPDEDANPPVVIQRSASGGTHWIEISVGREFKLTVFGKLDLEIQCPISGKDAQAHVEGRYHADQIIKAA